MSKTNASLMKRREAAVPRGVGQIHPIFAESAKNATVTDVEGREFIDFAGGIAVLNTGHVHPKIIAAVTEQLNKLTHTCFQVLAYEPYVELCEKINAKVPGDFAKKTLLVTTGSEAVENAVKIARASLAIEFAWSKTACWLLHNSSALLRRRLSSLRRLRDKLIWTLHRCRVANMSHLATEYPTGSKRVGALLHRRTVWGWSGSGVDAG